MNYISWILFSLNLFFFCQILQNGYENPHYKLSRPSTAHENIAFEGL